MKIAPFDRLRVLAASKSRCSTGFRSKSNVVSYGKLTYIARGCRARLRRPYLPPGVDEFAQRRMMLLAASGGSWNRYDFPVL